MISADTGTVLYNKASHSTVVCTGLSIAAMSGNGGGVILQPSAGISMSRHVSVWNCVSKWHIERERRHEK